MAQSGETIYNPSTGERITFLRTRDETLGELLEFEVVLEPGARLGGLPHRHLVAERLVVDEGVLASWLAGRGRREHGPGDEILVPPMRGHFIWNAGVAEARARAEARPADDVETMFETFFGIATDGGARVRGMPPPLQAALLAHTYGLYAPIVPVALQKVLLAALADVARRRGYTATYPARPIDPDGSGPSQPIPPPGGPGHLRAARTENFIAKPREEAWELLATPRRYPEWLFGPSSFQRADDTWPDPGAMAELKHGIGPVGIRGSYTVLHVAEPSELELHVQLPPLLETRKRFNLTATPAGTHVTLRERPLGGALTRLSSLAATLLLEAAGTLSLVELRRLTGSPAGLWVRSMGSDPAMATAGEGMR